MKGDRLYNKALFEAKLGNDKVAFDLLEKSAKYKNSKAYYALATWYLHGKYVKKDVYTGNYYLRLSAELKNPDAFFNLGISYEKGAGIDKNEDKAFECYLQASLRGHKQSCYEVGRCYYYGIGIKEDKDMAEIWLERAEELGITE